MICLLRRTVPSVHQTILKKNVGKSQDSVIFFTVNNGVLRANNGCSEIVPVGYAFFRSYCSSLPEKARLALAAAQYCC